MPERVWRFHIEQESTGNVLILSISGRIGSAAAASLEDALTRCPAEARAVVVDLGGVDYISAPGLAALRRAAAAGNGAFVLCAVTPPVQIALDLADLGEEIAVEPDRGAALARLGFTP